MTRRKSKSKSKPEPNLYCGPGRNRVHCRRCGEVMELPLPMRVVHERCQPPSAAESPPVREDGADA